MIQRVALLITALFFSFMLASGQSPEPLPAITHVLLISLDGARPDAIQQVNTPNIDQLVAHGAVAWQASTVLPPVTLPAHTSMLTGYGVDEHGVEHNDYSSEKISTPTFLTLAQDAGYRTAMVVGKNKLEQFHQHEGTFYHFAEVGDRSVVDAVIPLLEDGYEIIFAHFPNPDFFGHLTEWMSETYLYELTNTDAQIGRLVDVLESLDLLDSTLIVITADHGGQGRSHGRNRSQIVHIPWIIASPGVQAGLLLDDNIHVTDTAHTILWALGLPLPETESGRPVIEAFTPEFVEQMR